MKQDPATPPQTHGSPPTPARRRGHRFRRATSRYMEFLGPHAKEGESHRPAGFEDGDEGGSNASWESSCHDASTEEEAPLPDPLQKDTAGSGRKQKTKKLSLWTGGAPPASSLKRRGAVPIPVQARKRSRKPDAAQAVYELPTLPTEDGDFACGGSDGPVGQRGRVPCEKEAGADLLVEGGRPSVREGDVLSEANALRPGDSPGFAPGDVEEAGFPGAGHDEQILGLAKGASTDKHIGCSGKLNCLAWGRGCKESSAVEGVSNARGGDVQCRRTVPEEIQPVLAWLYDFVRHVEESSEDGRGFKMEPVSRLLRQHPELVDLVKQKSSGSEAVGRGQAGPEDQTDCFISNLKASMEAVPRPGFSFQSWLSKTARQAESLPSAQKKAHWHSAQKHILVKTLVALPHQLQNLAGKYANEAEDRTHLTSGVSYILPSESCQEGVPEFTRLSHTVIQPPSLKEVSSNNVSTSLEVIKQEEVAVVLLPIRDDSIMKDYLLIPSKRKSIIDSNPGTTLTTLKGLGGLNGNLHDRLLICVHYKKMDSGSLQPCAAHFSQKLNAPENNDRLPGIDEGNIEIAVIVRKGIGGTCPLRAAARSLEARGILPVLLGTIPWKVIEALPQERNSPADVSVLCSAHSGLLSSRFQDGRTYSPYKLVPAGAEQGLVDVPPADTTSVGEWFASIQASASQVLESLSSCQVLKPSTKASASKAHGNDGDHTDGFCSEKKEAKKLKGSPIDDKRAVENNDRLADASAVKSTQKKSARKGTGPTKTSKNSLQDFMQGEDCREEVDELISDMQLLNKGREDDIVGNLTTSKLLMYTLSCRLEMFVQENDWKNSSGHEKNELFSIVRGTEAWLASRIKEWNILRLKNFSDGLLDAVRSDPCFSGALDEANDTADIPCLTKRTKPQSNAEVVQDSTVCNNQNKDKAGGYCRNRLHLEKTPLKGAPVLRRPRKIRRVSASFGADSKEAQDEHELVEPGVDMDGCARDDVDCDFSSQVVKLVACASCLGSMLNLSISDFPWPYYFISTRDCFKYQLLPIRTKVELDGRGYIKTDFYFQPGEIPENYHQIVKMENELEADFAGSSTENNGFKTPIRATHSMVHKRHLETSTSILEDSCFEENNEGISVHNPKVKNCTSPSVGLASANSNLVLVSDQIPHGAHPVGVTTYTQIFSDDELKEIESMADQVQKMAHDDLLPKECYHDTLGRGGNLKRTKYFFGARYLWTKEQLSDPTSKRANGVRMDVPTRPSWMKSLVEDPLVESQIIPMDFVNSWALNMYHDGSEGIQSHFDDAIRFMRPIYSLRLFSDSRLSFGTQLYGYTNGSFYIPMPRGCITIMQEGSYAADGAKHCVRPIDMQGKNAGLIMRRINPEAMLEAWKFHLEESSLWLKSLALEDGSTPFKKRANKVIAQEGNTKGLDEGALCTICQKVLDRCIHRVERNERRKVSEVRSVMEGLIRGVIRGVQQEVAHVKKHEQKDRVVVKRVLDGMIRKIEHQARRAGKQERTEKRLESQIGSVIENIVRRLENGTAEGSKKILLRMETSRKPSAGSSHMTKSRESRTFEFLLSIAAEVLEAVACHEPAMLRAAQTLLEKFGISWAKALKEKQDFATRNSPSGSSLEQASDAGSSARVSYSSQWLNPPRPTVFELPPLTTVTGHTSTTKDWLGNPLKQYRQKRCPPRREFVRAISAMLRPAPESNSKPLQVPPVVPKRPYSTRGKGKTRKFEDYAMSSSDEDLSASQENSGVRSKERAQEDEACFEIGNEDQVIDGKVMIMNEFRQKALVKELLATVLRAVAHLIVPPETKAGPSQANGIAQKSEIGSLISKANKLLNGFNWNAGDGLPRLASPKRVKTEFCLTAGDEGKRRYKLVPWCVCFACEKPGVDPLQPPSGKTTALPSDSTLMWQCRGKCRRSFHYSCRSPPTDASGGQCSDCASERHCCLICGRNDPDAGEVVKCSMGVCGKFYHPECVLANPVTNVFQGTWIPVGDVDGNEKGMRFRCPQHYCRTCGLSGANIYSVSCIRCPNAYHSRCCPPGCRRLSKKLVLCPEHDLK